MEATVTEILAGRHRPLPGLLYRHKSKGALLDAYAVQPAIDASKMCATFTISTPTPDRSEDVVNPLGCLLENYRQNPVVLYDHGFSGINLPIAKSEDPDGNLTVVPSETGIEATAYFSQSFYEAQQIFALVTEGILRTSSIHLDPISSTVRSSGSGYRPGLQIDQWELLEWSIVGIPDNPEATRKVLDHNRLADRPIAESIFKSLLPFAAHTKPQGKGWTPPEVSPVAKTIAPVEPIAKTVPGTTPVAKADPPQVPPAEATADTTPADEETEPKGEETEPTEQPLGATVMSAAIGQLSQFSRGLAMACGPMENPTIKDMLMSLSDELAGKTAELESAYDSAYPDFPRKDMSVEEETEAKSLAKFLRSNSAKSMQLRGLAHRVNALASAKNLTKDQRDTLGRTVEQITKMLDVAKAMPEPKVEAPAPTAPAVDLTEIIKAIGEVKDLFSDVAKQIKDSVPYQRRKAG